MSFLWWLGGMSCLWMQNSFRLVLFFNFVSRKANKSARLVVVFEGPDLFCLLSGSTFLSLDLIFRFSELFHPVLNRS